MLSPLLVGIVLGLSAGISPGPLLTLVITQTLTYGIKEGMKVAVAPFASDVPIIIVSLLILNRLTNFKPLLGIITVVGAIYVFYLAYESLKTKPVLPGATMAKAQSLQKGTLVNFLSPHPYLFWISVGGPLVLKFNAKGMAGPIMFMVGFYLLLVGSKLGMAFLVGQSRRLLTGRRYVYIMRMLSCALALFALFLLKDAAVFLEIWPA
jgi:threonine/homoserine/homoserine lactone efflux protein